MRHLAPSSKGGAKHGIKSASRECAEGDPWLARTARAARGARRQAAESVLEPPRGT
jgi:hypothetical protein